VVGFFSFGIGNIYGTKVCVESLINDIERDSATVRVLCPSVKMLQPCVDDFSCKQCLEKDFGGRVLLEWMVRPIDY
jgi:hypothetical protein